MREAFRVYDPADTGYANPAALRRIFEDLGHGKISDEDLAVLAAA